MKRTVLAAVLVVAMVFGVVVYATGATGTDDVVITAKVNPAFQFSLLGADAITLEADPLITPSATAGSQLRVKSNQLWEFSKAIAYSDAAITPFMTDTTKVATVDFAAGTGKARGVTTIDTSYTLDFSADEAAALELPQADYTVTYTYTATQTP